MNHFNLRHKTQCYKTVYLYRKKNMNTSQKKIILSFFKRDELK